MGIMEVVKEHLLEEAKEEGWEEGMEKGVEKGELKQAITSIRNMHKKGFAVDDMTEILEVPKSLALNIQKQLANEQAIRKELKTAHEKIAKKLKVHPLLVQVVRESIK